MANAPLALAVGIARRLRCIRVANAALTWNGKAQEALQQPPYQPIGQPSMVHVHQRYDKYYADLLGPRIWNISSGLPVGNRGMPILYNTSTRQTTFIMRHCQRTISSSSSTAAPQIVSFPLAQTGEGISECELIQWFVKEGDVVKEFDKLCEVQSDKASVEITSRFDAVVKKLHHTKGDVVKVGATLADLEVAAGQAVPDDLKVSKGLDASGSVAESAPSPQPPQHTSTTPISQQAPETIAQDLHSRLSGSIAEDDAPQPMVKSRTERIPGQNTQTNDLVKASPAVRRLARELDVDLADVEGSGPGGRITREDVSRHAQESKSGLPAVAYISSSPLPSSQTASSPAQPTTATEPIPRPSPPQTTSIPVRGYRRAMIKSMTSASLVPHFYLHDEATVNVLMALRKHLAGDPALKGTKLTMLPFIIKAVSMALRDHPMLNASLSADQTTITVHGPHNIGVAMATSQGLVVPNIKQVESLTVADIAQEVARLQAAATAGKLATEDVTGGTFTISNIGSIGGLFANPLVNPPEAAILAIGRVCKVAVSEAGHANLLGNHGHEPHSHTTNQVLGMSWGADHRVVDGAALAYASNAVKAYLEQPERMLLKLR